MDLNKLCADWKEIGGKKYIVRNMFGCLGIVDDHFGLIPCSYGGPFLRKRTRMPSFFDIITNSGKKVVSRDVKCEPGSIKTIWCQGGKIGLLYQPGIINVYRISGELVATYQDANKSDIILSSEFYNGIATLHSDGQLTVFDFSLNRFHPFQKINLASQPLCMDFIRGEQNECYIAFEDQSVYVIRETEIVFVKKVPFVPNTILISATGTYLAITNNNRIYIFSIASEEESIFTAPYPIDSFAFFDENRVIAIINSKTYVFGVPNINFELPFAKASLVVQDTDHTKLYTTDGMYFIQPIPYAIGSLVKNKKFHKLFTMRDLYEKEDPNFITLLREVESEAPRSISTLLFAAQSVIDPTLQELILSVAIFLIHIFGLDRSEYIYTIRKLRMLNTIRSPEFGFTTTAQGLDLMQPVHTIEFAMEMNFYEFAYRACNLFDYNSSLVAISWATTMFYLHGDKSLSQVIGKIETIQSPDYAALVNAAKSSHMSSKSQEILIDRVRNPKQKCIFLMRLPQAQPLEYALHTLDGEAIIRTLYFNKLKLTPPGFQDVLTSNPRALDHYVAYKKFVDPKVLTQVPDINVARLMMYLMCYEVPPARFGKLPDQMFALARLMNKKTVWSKNVRRHGKALLDLEEKKETLEPGETPRECVRRIFKDGNHELAMKVAKRYHVTPRMYTNIQLSVFKEVGNWNSIENMANMKQPLSYEEFAKFCAENGNKPVAMVFIRKMKSYEKMIELAKSLGMENEANILYNEWVKSGKKPKK
ncbi:hypothetical protein TVAG_208940 [Trichomonas vaginalis G3]|uniref:Vps16 N-terminal domain-containing protein n=1 Tax=Trichomonas vaginalis (strain ATCC PRA-98 / G3) TaxID=412133 RepID=A2DVD6_TRIV3|nr:regulation of vacuole fusion, non-autophagic [Trichomonas vaginalis G3]EAY15615.1 hypothetical protein TVAG_208940 [Trichomonas vaginalis G3]KAI5530222.1 regulation of vacuole fusion, non-autophagic [Trichomonas vaginalis G3]|eukprot:XP_001327838.1 hypothetical protein [Trichomonas vaginalis G3]